MSKKDSDDESSVDKTESEKHRYDEEIFSDEESDASFSESSSEEKPQISSEQALLNRVKDTLATLNALYDALKIPYEDMERASLRFKSGLEEDLKQYCENLEKQVSHFRAKLPEYFKEIDPSILNDVVVDINHQIIDLINAETANLQSIGQASSISTEEGRLLLSTLKTITLDLREIYENTVPDLINNLKKSTVIDYKKEYLKMVSELKSGKLRVDDERFNYKFDYFLIYVNFLCTKKDIHLDDVLIAKEMSEKLKVILSSAENISSKNYLKDLAGLLKNLDSMILKIRVEKSRAVLTEILRIPKEKASHEQISKAILMLGDQIDKNHALLSSDAESTQILENINDQLLNTQENLRSMQIARKESPAKRDLLRNSLKRFSRGKEWVEKAKRDAPTVVGEQQKSDMTPTQSPKQRKKV